MMTNQNNKKPLSIYIHIPFCIKKCLYCDFLSGPASEAEQQVYISCLKQEIEAEARHYAGHEVQTVFIGGGTPSAVDSGYIREIMETLLRFYTFADNPEITIEVNPGTVSEEKLKDYQSSGINRISIGLQTANEEELKALGRIHTVKDFFDTYNSIVKLGFNNINVDLMSAIPLQTMESCQSTLERVLQLQPQPSHLSAYSLIVEEGTPFYLDTPKLPDEDTEREMYKITDDILTKNGYHRYEISNYAKPGYECKHNKVYWQRGDYAGFGIGAASLVGNVRFSNLRNREDYVNRIEAWKENGKEEPSIKENVQKLSTEEQIEEFMFLGLRLVQGISTEEFHQCFGAYPEQVYPGLIDSLCSKGLLIREWDQKNETWRLRLSEYGMDVSNVVMAEFLLS